MSGSDQHVYPVYAGETGDEDVLPPVAEIIKGQTIIAVTEDDEWKVLWLSSGHKLNVHQGVVLVYPEPGAAS